MQSSIFYGDEMAKLTKSQQIILAVLRENSNGMTPKEILNRVDFAPRTVRYALRKLLSRRLVTRVSCLQDMRQYIYMPLE